MGEVRRVGILHIDTCLVCSQLPAYEIVLAIDHDAAGQMVLASRLPGGQVNKISSKRQALAAGILAAVVSCLFVSGCAWDRSEECADAIAEHGVLLMDEAENVAGAQGAPEVSCDDTGGPPAYAAFDLQPHLEGGFNEVLARQGWRCAEKADDEEVPGVVCTKTEGGVPLELDTDEFLNGKVQVWIYADPPWIE